MQMTFIKNIEITKEVELKQYIKKYYYKRGACIPEYVIKYFTQEESKQALKEIRTVLASTYILGELKAAFHRAFWISPKMIKQINI